MSFTMNGNAPNKERFVSALGGGALLLEALRARGSLGDVLSKMGKALIRRGATFYPGPPATHVEASVTIGRPREDVYRFCRDLTNVPRFMRGLKEVKTLDGGKSRWIARGKRGMDVAWDLVIVEDVENERIGWRTVDDRGVTRSGVVYLTPAPGERGVEVCVMLEIAPAARRRGERAEIMLRGDLRRLKQLLEVGHLATTRGQPSGRNVG